LLELLICLLKVFVIFGILQNALIYLLNYYILIKQLFELHVLCVFVAVNKEAKGLDLLKINMKKRHFNNVKQNTFSCSSYKAKILKKGNK
jgi:hypothetical protein